MVPPHEPHVLQRIRGLLLAILTMVMAGTVADLLLLHHYEDTWQLLPLVMIGLALLIVGWLSFSGGATAVAAMRILMVLFIATGMLGILLHYNSNREFQRETDPALGGWALFVKAMTAKAPPALAPAVMIHIGLLGLLYTYRHPSLRRMDSYEATY
jgi:hypothetical protein